MVDLETRRAQLNRRLNALDRQLHGIEDELETHNNRDWEELAVEREGDEVLEGLGNKGLAEIRQIKSALARMDAGEYGFCGTCGGTISEDRLNVLPFTPFCRKCAP